jgi:excisionase family DNA binding protein
LSKRRGGTQNRSGADDGIGLAEAAELLGVHYMTAYRYVRTGMLPAHRAHGRWVVPVSEIEAMAARSDDDPVPARARRAPHRARLVARMLASDASGAWMVVERALAAGLSPRSAVLDLIAGALRDIGDGWERGELTVGQEHAATAVGSRLLGRLGPLITRRGPSRGAIVLAGAPGEQHTLCMVILADLLRADGWRVVELGGDTPVADLIAAMTESDRLVAVGICVGSRQTRKAAAEAAAAVHAAADDVTVLIGGPGVTDARTARRLGADGWGRDADAVTQLLTERPARKPGRSGRRER